MPPHTQIHTTITTLPIGPTPVIAIIGGTSGIGSYIAKAFASVYRNSGYKLRVYIVGRSTSRAEALLAEVCSTTPGSEWRFVKAHDLALMSDIDAVCAQIKRYEEEEPSKGGGGPRIDMLYMSQAISPLALSDTTKEGLDTQMFLLYYSRIRFILALIPLLLGSQNPSGAHVVSVFAGTMEDRIDAKNLPIGPPRHEAYGVTSVRTHVSFMKTYLFEALAEEHAGKISFLHVYPGLVHGPTFYSHVNPLWFRVLWRVAKVMMSWYMTSPEVCDEVMVSLGMARYPARGLHSKGNVDKGGGEMMWHSVVRGKEEAARMLLAREVTRKRKLVM